MPVTALFPKRLEDRWGKEISEEFVSWLEAFIKEKSVSRDEYREVLSRLDVIENTLDHIRDEQSRQRQELNQLRSEMNERFDKMNERFDKMNERFDRMNERLQSTLKWTVGVFMGMGSLLAILMSIYKFMG